MIKRIFKAIFGVNDTVPTSHTLQPKEESILVQPPQDKVTSGAITSGQRVESEVYEEDFIGNEVTILGSPFRIAIGTRIDTDDSSDRWFRFYRGKVLIRQACVPRRIEYADLLADGRFCIMLPGADDIRGNEIWFFDAIGQQVTSTFIPAHVPFIRLQPSWTLLFSMNDVVTHLSLNPLKELLHFTIPWGFIPTDGRVLSDGCIILRDADRGVFRFSSDGTFLDHVEWRQQFLEMSSGETIFHVIKREYEESVSAGKLWTNEQYQDAVHWLDLALSRGITDSYYLKKAEVFSLKSYLLHNSGDAAGAAEAATAAENNKDGFSVVESAEAILARGQLTEDEIVKQLDLLEKAADYPRIKDYPNYYGKLLRFRGELFVMRGMLNEAIRSFEKALVVNPKVGCKRQLEKLKLKIK